MTTPGVVTVVLQQCDAERDEVRMRNAIILKNDSLLHVFEKPGDSANRADAAALIDIRIKTLDLARPVNLVFDHCTGGSHLLGFAESIRVGAIAGYKKPRRRYGPNGVNDLSERVWTTQAIRRSGVFMLIPVKYFCEDLNHSI